MGQNGLARRRRAVGDIAEKGKHRGAFTKKKERSRALEKERVESPKSRSRWGVVIVPV